MGNRFSLHRALATVCRRIGLWHNVPPLAAGPKRRPVLRGLATSGCYAPVLLFSFDAFDTSTVAMMGAMFLASFGSYWIGYFKGRSGDR